MKILRYIALAILPFAFFSCDNMDEDQYVIYPEGETAQTTPITKTQNEQAVLLEDYTGWKCVNCPAAAALLTNLKAKYGENLVAMSVHAGSFAEPAKANNNLDLRTDYGEKWNKEFGLSAYPIGVINRLNFGSVKAVQKDDWDNKIAEILASSQHLMNINLGAEKKDGYFLVSTQIKALADISFATLISVLVSEDGIMGVQLNSDANYGATPKIEDYSFNHVLRPNGLTDLLLRSSIAKNETIEKSFSVNIDPSWNTEKCKVIVFVSNAESGEIIQVNEITL